MDRKINRKGKENEHTKNKNGKKINRKRTKNE